ncbi:radical SAM/SPASM domain-containing protein [Clostridium butanoliproducens]|uniref:radical SAM/SPASM domain-containing protein n=1 Tax=Clostridium butanoliproducens TaxID=2991837 RepID=UPI0024BB8505|nr:radical SAM protein [Clostridium butanoliproducens]MDU1349838.1 radical SAM protein [Clostridium argentinense]
MIENKLEFIQSIINKKSKSIGIELTTYCPLNCIYCTRKLVNRKDKNLSLNQFAELKKSLQEFDNIIICGIGEPMVYPYIYDVIPDLKQRILFITSGTVKIDFKRLNAAKNIDVIIFSVDEPTREGMNKIANNYDWDNLIHNLNNVRKSGIMVTMINCTINRFNYKNIPKMIQFAKENKVKAINFTLDINKNDFKTVNKKDLAYYLSYTNDSKLNKGIMITNSTNSLKCLSWDRIIPYITLEGKVYPCCIGVKNEFYLGNIFKNSFDEIWNNANYKNFKKCDFCLECSMFKDYKNEDYYKEVK